MRDLFKFVPDRKGVKVLLIVALTVLLSVTSVSAEEKSTGKETSLPLSALTTSTGSENVAVKLENLSSDESMHYSFLYGYQAMLEGLCNGALLTFDKDDNYVTGYLTPSAPDDFCSRISAKTIAVAEPVTSETMSAMYTLFGDRFSLSTLMARDDEVYVAVIMFEPVDDMVVTPIWYAEAERKIKNEAVARGINPEDVFSLQLETNGLDKDTLVALVANGEKPSTIVSDAVSIQKTRQEQEKTSPLQKAGVDSNSITQFVILGLIIFGALMLGYLVVKFFTKDTQPTPEDEDEEETEESEETEETKTEPEGEN